MTEETKDDPRSRCGSATPEGQDLRVQTPISGVPALLEICICAAILFPDGRIVRGHRHDSCFRTAEGWTPKPEKHHSVQGFITSRNRFVGRTAGAALQNAAGLDSAMTGKPVKGILFSEDLYFDTHDRAMFDRLTIHAEPEGRSFRHGYGCPGEQAGGICSCGAPATTERATDADSAAILSSERRTSAAASRQDVSSKG